MTSSISLPLLCEVPHPLPRHLAIIMDGNRRWAKKHRLPAACGHQAGAKTIRRAVQLCADAGIEHLTLFAFSTENWRRGANEINLLLRLMKRLLKDDIRELHEQGISLKIIGCRERFTKDMQILMAQAERLTRRNDRMHLRLALNYGGRWEMVSAMKEIATSVLNGDLLPDDIDEGLIGSQTALHEAPPLDLCIRTGGDQRLSNFLLWDLAYAELYFSSAYWPDFDEEVLMRALSVFAARERRYGGHVGCFARD